MVTGELKDLYNVNQYLKIFNSAYIFNSEKSVFQTIFGSVIFRCSEIKRIDTKNIFVVTNGKKLFTFLKNSTLSTFSRLEDEFFNLKESERENLGFVFLTEDQYNDTYFPSVNSKQKIYDKLNSEKPLFTSSKLKLNITGEIITNIKQIKDIIAEYKKERNHTIAFIDINEKSNILNLRMNREEINHEERLVLIYDCKLLPNIKTKIKENKFFKISLFTNNIVEINYGTNNEIIWLYFRLS